jgi:hypothetical protein
MTGPVQGQVAVVTGANRGLGAEIACALAAAGASMAISALDRASLADTHCGGRCPRRPDAWRWSAMSLNPVRQTAWQGRCSTTMGASAALKQNHDDDAAPADPEPAQPAEIRGGIGSTREHVDRLGQAGHDPQLVAEARSTAESCRRKPADYELQMLYGVRSSEQVRLAQEGCNVRVYIPFGSPRTSPTPSPSGVTSGAMGRRSPGTPTNSWLRS